MDPELAGLTSTAATRAVQLLPRLADIGLITMQATTFGGSRVNLTDRDSHVTAGK